jgi:hypothetical protein
MVLPEDSFDRENMTQHVFALRAIGNEAVCEPYISSSSAVMIFDAEDSPLPSTCTTRLFKIFLNTLI